MDETTEMVMVMIVVIVKEQIHLSRWVMNECNSPNSIYEVSYRIKPYYAWHIRIETDRVQRRR